MSQATCLIVIRLRGTINLRQDVKDTLKMLRLNQVNHAIVIPSNPEYLGMLQKVKDCVTWGEVSEETLTQLLKKRGKMVGGKKITLDYLNEKGYKSFEDISRKIYSLDLKLKDLKEVKPVLRLHPPSKGFKKSLKRAFNENGEMGYRGSEINQLVKKMA